MALCFTFNIFVSKVDFTVSVLNIYIGTHINKGHEKTLGGDGYSSYLHFNDGHPSACMCPKVSNFMH